jgi:hypothetical protein
MEVWSLEDFHIRPFPQAWSRTGLFYGDFFHEESLPVQVRVNKFYDNDLVIDTLLEKLILGKKEYETSMDDRKRK